MSPPFSSGRDKITFGDWVLFGIIVLMVILACIANK